MVLRWLEKRARQKNERQRLGLPVYREEPGRPLWPPAFDDEARALRGMAEDRELDMQSGARSPDEAWGRAEREAMANGTAGWIVEADLPKRMRSGSGRLYWWNGERFVLSKRFGLPYREKTEADQVAGELNGRTGIPMRVRVAVIAWVVCAKHPGGTVEWWGGEKCGWVTELSRSLRYAWGADAYDAAKSLQSTTKRQKGIKVECTTLAEAMQN